MVGLRLSVALWVLAASTGVARADDDAQAKKLFLSATKKYDKGDYQGAILEYERAYDLVPRAKILLNLGAAYLKLGKSARAATYFAKYVDHEKADAKRLGTVKATLARLDRKIGRLELDIRVEDGSVYLDGEPIGDSPLVHTMRVEPGDHQVRVDGGASWSKTEPISVSAGQTLKVLIVGDPAAANPESTRSVASTSKTAETETAVTRSLEAPEPGRLGIFLRTDVDAAGRGAVVAPGISVRVAGDLEAFASGLAGGNFGAEIGARMSFGPWRLRPVVTAAAPLFFDDGARPGVRGALGVCFSIGRVQAGVDIGAARAFSVPADHVRTVVLASAGVEMKL